MGTKPPRDWKLPPDEASLRELITTLSEALAQKALHLMEQSHDYRARRTFRYAHQRRVMAFRLLKAINPQAALQVAGELGLVGANEVM